MWIARTPNRISLFGGSCDYSDFFSKYGCLMLSLAINKYCYVSCQKLPEFAPISYQAFYSKAERVDNIAEIENPGIRGSLEYLNRKIPIDKIALYTQNQIMPQTGLGTSSSHVISVLNAVQSMYGLSPKRGELARDAINVERVLLKEVGGIGDQIICAYGGLVSISINENGYFKVRPLPVSGDFISEFLSCSVLFYTNSQRQSFEIASSHNNDNKKRILDVALDAKFYFEIENLEKIGKLLHESWLAKKQVSNLISNSFIDEKYDILMKNGAFGGKLLGSGGSGFIYCLCPKEKRQQIINAVQLPTLDFNIDYSGSTIIFKDV